MRVACVLVLWLAAAARALALDVQVKDVHAAASIVRATVEVRDVVPDRFRKLIDAGGVLHLRLQSELWESRPVWDRLVFPALTRIFRLVRPAPSRDIAIFDSASAAQISSVLPNPLTVPIDLGDRSRLTAPQRYYVHIIATIGTLAEREADAAGDAVFGKESETNALGSLGRLVFRTALQVSDYMQSVTAETRTRKIAGSEILK
jgi:hypothetical protein